MSTNISVQNDDAKLAMDEFDTLARKMGFVPTAEARALGAQLAMQFLKQHGIVLPTEPAPQPEAPVPGTTEATPAQPPAAEGGSPAAGTSPAEPAKRKGGRKPNPPAPAVDPAQTDPIEFAKQGAPPAEPLQETPAEKYGFPESELSVKAEPAKTYTAEDAKAALRTLAARLDLEACRALLDHYGVKKASEVPVDKIGAFAADAALAANTSAEFKAALKT